MRGTIQQLDSFLPGTLFLDRGTIQDFRELERFHYRQRRPATWAGIWVVRYLPCSHSHSRTVAVAVLSYPTLNSTARDDALNLHALPRDRKTAFLNSNLRTLSRVIVHPQFRSLGLASRLVHYVCHQCKTRWVEAHAAMGRVHPFFEKGGMQKYDRGPNRPVYYLFDRASLLRLSASPC
jgi:GNAT superfamily N-acetyltransferase